MDHWVERLQNALADEAVQGHENVRLAEPEFYQFVKRFTVTLDWDEPFLAETYEKYLLLLNKATDN